MMEANDRSDKLSAASVAIDGTRIRTVREAKRLTQLYVASVVGVTTDTISRWENNRYPSIKRENAQKLADALEVPLDDILRQEPPAPEGEADADLTPPSPRRKKLLVLFGLFTLLLLLAVVILSRPPSSAPIAVRWLPRYAAPGEIIPVQIKVTRLPSKPFGFILKEKLPDGMRLVSSVPPSSAAEPARSSLKWLVPSGGNPVVISYSVRTPAPFAQGKEVKVKGEIVLHGEDANRTEEVGGGSDVRIGPYHWADANGDGRIDDDEIMPAYYICDEMKGLGLDWKTIEAIWSGKGYRWDPKNGYTVLK
ncbi:Transcriptional regulator [Citrifermentans bremense]|uniref:Transcriptional regulator n=1 Tax=Citrifermentans bremense TaxID=60035 RepID=A0A6S6M4C0_9BACT|nr:helix-turn-helix transcriptional regulator [Citrifermentans bremense]BCG49167.1 Transcriptional regulator [Citrifermentans bremense]